MLVSQINFTLKIEICQNLTGIYNKIGNSILMQSIEDKNSRTSKHNVSFFSSAFFLTIDYAHSKAVISNLLTFGRM